MIVEAYSKSKGGKTYYTIYHRLGKVTVTVADIEADGEEAAIRKSAGYLEKALNEHSQVNQ